MQPLLPVIGEHLPAREADSVPVCLQAVEDREHIRVLIVPHQLPAKPHHIRMASRALLVVALSERTGNGRRLRRYLREYHGTGGRYDSDREEERAQHDCPQQLAGTRRLSHDACGVPSENRALKTLACVQPPRGDKSRRRAVSSAGRASALHAECRRFESVTAHQPSQAGRREGCCAKANPERGRALPARHASAYQSNNGR